MKKRRKLKKKVIVFIILIIVLLASITGVALYKKSSDSPKVQKRKVVDSISNYGYSLEDDDPKIYKDLFNELTKVLNVDEVDYDEYATLISQMFAIDFYNLDNKKSKNDIGGVEFIYEDSKENFILQASDTVYKYIKNNFDGKRSQKLPEVEKVELISLTNEEYKYKDIKDDNAYIAKIKITYKENMDYPSELIIKLLHNDKKLEVYYMK